MLWQVQATLFFNEEDEGKDFFHDCHIALQKATVIHPGSPLQQASIIQLLECFHDIEPTKPCILLEHELSAPPL